MHSKKTRPVHANTRVKRVFSCSPSYLCVACHVQLPLALPPPWESHNRPWRLQSQCALLVFSFWLLNEGRLSSHLCDDLKSWPFSPCLLLLAKPSLLFYSASFQQELPTAPCVDLEMPGLLKSLWSLCLCFGTSVSACWVGAGRALLCFQNLASNAEWEQPVQYGERLLICCSQWCQEGGKSAVCLFVHY